MMTPPARRDGTPDRQPHRRNQTSRNESPRNESPRNETRRNETPRTGRGRSESPRSNQGAAETPRPAVGRKKPQPPRPAPKQARPVRRTDVPTISNAKPARRQHVESDQRAEPSGEGVRLQKVLAAAGVASRRAAEEMIADGRVEVDGRIVQEMGTRIDPEVAVVRVDGVRVVVAKDTVYLAMNKPRGWQSTMSDDLGRPCVGDIVRDRVAAGQRLFHVGRLDADTEGLLLFTNDGELAHRLMHPSYEVRKTYLATVTGVVPKTLGRTLKAGIELDDGLAKADQFTVLEISEGRSLVRIVLHEGRKHIVRRLLGAAGFPVDELVRTHIGSVAIGSQRPGSLRPLGRDEVGALYKAVGL